MWTMSGPKETRKDKQEREFKWTISIVCYCVFQIKFGKKKDFSLSGCEDVELRVPSDSPPGLHSMG